MQRIAELPDLKWITEIPLRKLFQDRIVQFSNQCNFLLNFLFGGSDVVFKSADEFTADLRGEGQGGQKKLIRETPEIGENL